MTKNELLEAASAGNTEAACTLGNKYYIGMRGFEKDIDRARLWWQRAAENDNSEAQFYLGILFYTGEGMPAKSKEEAFLWWKKSAANGYEIANKYLKNPPPL